MEHLETELTELHRRLTKVVLVYILCALPLAYKSSALYTLFAAPLLALLAPEQRLIATDVFSPFMVPLRLSLWVALGLVVPFALYQIWHFVAPGLYKTEQKMLKPLILWSVSLFYGGMCFAYYLVCPLALRFLLSTAPEGVTIMTDLGAYFQFILHSMFAFGLGAQVPIISFVLVRSGLVSTESMRNKRPYVVIGAFVLGMLLTPPDVVSQILLAVPLWSLFELGLWFATRKQKRELPKPI